MILTPSPCHSVSPPNSFAPCPKEPMLPLGSDGKHLMGPHRFLGLKITTGHGMMYTTTFCNPEGSN